MMLRLKCGPLGAPFPVANEACGMLANGTIVSMANAAPSRIGRDGFLLAMVVFAGVSVIDKCGNLLRLKSCVGLARNNTSCFCDQIFCKILYEMW